MSKLNEQMEEWSKWMHLKGYSHAHDNWTVQYIAMLLTTREQYTNLDFRMLEFAFEKHLFELIDEVMRLQDIIPSGSHALKNSLFKYAIENDDIELFCYYCPKYPMYALEQSLMQYSTKFFKLAKQQVPNPFENQREKKLHYEFFLLYIRYFVPSVWISVMCEYASSVLELNPEKMPYPKNFPRYWGAKGAKTFNLRELEESCIQWQL